jgi:hypothetical protein
MALYKCPCGTTEKEIKKATIVLRNSEWVTKEALCPCGKYMESEPEEGMPQIKRTEASLSKDAQGHMLWEGAKEKLCGERGINEPFD